jgi:hypothetical protein
MNRIALIALLCIFLSPSAFAQEWSSDQINLWQFVEQSWVDDSKETGKWPDEYVHNSVQSWDSAWPAPRGKSSMAKWTSFRDSTSELLQYELFPHSLVIEGDTGVAFYSVVDVRRNSEGDVERSVTGIVETAVRDRDSWKYIGLTSFDIGSNSD